MPQRKSEQIEELLLLQRVTQQINSILDLDLLLEEIVGDVARTFGYSRSAVLLKDDETHEVVIAAVRGWTSNYHLKGERFKIGEYGMVGHAAATEETYYAPDVTVDPYYQVSEALTRSEIDIPLKVRGRLIGIFNAQHNEVAAFSASRIQLLEALAGHIAVAIENARMFQRERLEKERLAAELNEATGIQRTLFPPQAPRLSGFTVTGLCVPCRSVGGDWYDYIPLAGNRLAVVLGDVAGKGMGAALLMSSTRSIVRLFADGAESPGGVLSRVNSVLVDDFPTARFVTMVYAVLDADAQSVTFANAGHLHPLFVDSAGASFIESGEGLPLGIRHGTFSNTTVDMVEGSRLVLYSDGVTEAMNALQEEYGATRVRDHFSQPTASIETLLEDVGVFSGARAASDDVTIVTIAAG
jgi:sigma-B regulation protein RsbU (phosphoserine phosphatase)